MGRRQRGFTLAELMVGVSIMGILLSIATPGLVRAQRKAREEAARATLKAIRDAQEEVANDTGLFAFPTDLHRTAPVRIGYRFNSLGVPTSGAAYPTGSWRGPYLKMRPLVEAGNWWYYESPLPNVIFVFDGNAQPGQNGVYLYGWGPNGVALDGSAYNTW